MRGSFCLDELGWLVASELCNLGGYIEKWWPPGQPRLSMTAN